MAVPHDVLERMTYRERAYREEKKQESLRKYWDEHLSEDESKWGIAACFIWCVIFSCFIIGLIVEFICSF